VLVDAVYLAWPVRLSFFSCLTAFARYLLVDLISRPLFFFSQRRHRTPRAPLFEVYAEDCRSLSFFRFFISSSDVSTAREPFSTPGCRMQRLGVILPSPSLTRKTRVWPFLIFPPGCALHVSIAGECESMQHSPALFPMGDTQVIDHLVTKFFSFSVGVMLPSGDSPPPLNSAHDMKPFSL